jgi:hypothetical protein
MLGRVDRTFQTDVRGREGARPEDGTASGAS